MQHLRTHRRRIRRLGPSLIALQVVRTSFGFHENVPEVALPLPPPPAREDNPFTLE